MGEHPAQVQDGNRPQWGKDPPEPGKARSRRSFSNGRMVLDSLTIVVVIWQEAFVGLIHQG